MTTSLIAAVAENYVIGKNNDLIWYLPKDLNFFKNTTKGHFVIMGRKNWLSIPEKYRPLPGRPNVVVTRQKDFKAEGCHVVHSIEEGLALAKAQGETEAFVIGGGQIYKAALESNLIDKMYITWVHKTYEGDTFFPQFDATAWNEVAREVNEADTRHEVRYDFTTYEKH
jgi:dihydrofolate reductase